MENYLHSYKELKSHYKELLQDLTNKFKAVIENLQREKCELQADNDMFKSGAVGDGIGKLSS